MRLAVSSDEANELTQALIKDLQQRGHTLRLFGPLAPDDADVDWPLTSSHAAEAVARGEADEGIVCCWTGTGASIAANKVPGIRAALCQDAITAQGARLWNEANVLALSLRATSIPVMREILEAWFAPVSSTDEAQRDWNRLQFDRVKALEEKYQGK